MAYREEMANRVREMISLTHKKIEEKKMFGGLCFMVNDKMCIGVNKDHILVRFDPTRNNEMLAKEGCEPMNFGGRTMKGYVYVNEDVLNTRKELEYWINLALDYNDEAKSSKKSPSRTKHSGKK